MNDGNGKLVQLTTKDFKSDQEVRWCPGCGDYAILNVVQSVMPALGIPRERIVFVSGIGCAARFPYYMQTYGISKRDIALVSAKRTWFLLGLGSFLLSHLAYIGAFATVRPNALVAVLVAAGLLVPAGLVARWLWPHLGADMRVPVLAYIAVITGMVAAAAGAAAGAGPRLPSTAALVAGEPIARWVWQVAVMAAAVSFYLSDVSVARDRFVAPGFDNRIWGLPLYYAAQLLFALSTGWL